MPLIRIDAVKGRSRREIRNILDAAHEAVSVAFKNARNERIQIYHEHPAGNLIAEGFEPGISGTDRLLLITLVVRPHSQELKLAFYRSLCQELGSRCAVQPRDVVVTVLTNSDADWSLGNGWQPFIHDFA